MHHQLRNHTFCHADSLCIQGRKNRGYTNKKLGLIKKTTGRFGLRSRVLFAKQNFHGHQNLTPMFTKQCLFTVSISNLNVHQLCSIVREHRGILNIDKIKSNFFVL